MVGAGDTKQRISQADFTNSETRQTWAFSAITYGLSSVPFQAPGRGLTTLDGLGHPHHPSVSYPVCDNLPVNSIERRTSIHRSTASVRSR